MIAFEVNDEVTTVSVLGIFYGGRDYEVYSATPTWQTTNQTTTDSLHETRVKDFR